MYTDYFQRAAEPLFNSNPVDSNFCMEAVFPGCLAATAFVNALIYSIVYTANKGQVSVEGLRLQGKALQSLHNSFNLPGLNLSYSDIGAIMVLQGVAVCYLRAISRFSVLNYRDHSIVGMISRRTRRTRKA